MPDEVVPLSKCPYSRTSLEQRFRISTDPSASLHARGANQNELEWNRHLECSTHLLPSRAMPAPELAVHGSYGSGSARWSVGRLAPRAQLFQLRKQPGRQSILAIAHPMRAHA